MPPATLQRNAALFAVRTLVCMYVCYCVQLYSVGSTRLYAALYLFAALYLHLYTVLQWHCTLQCIYI